MYKIYVDNVLICSSKADDTAVINPLVILEANRAGSFTFTLPRDHPFYGEIKQRKSMIDVVQDGETIFEGIATEIKDDFYGQREISCEGELTFLNDTIQRPARYQDRKPAQLLTAFIAAHNAQVESSKQFTVGIVTAEDPNDSIYCYTNYENTMKCIGDDLLDDIGGYLRIRHENGVRILDYLAESPHTNTQVIAIGKNLIDLIKNVDTLDLCTVLIPLGNRLETQTIPGLEDRLTIESVNEGLDYLENAAAIQMFGRITKTVIWDDVGIAENLKTKGKDYLTNAQYAHMVIEATAFDLGLATDVFEKFRLLDMVRVVSEPHGLDRNFMITKLSLNLNAPENNKITLGDDTVVKISAKTSQALDRITQQTDQAVSTAVQAAAANASALINSAMGGYILKTRNELYIMDTADLATATKVWRWNLGGLGYWHGSPGGAEGGTYSLAMTQDGAIVADFITTGILNAARIKAGILQDTNNMFSLDLATGTLIARNAIITGGSINIDTNSDNISAISLNYEYADHKTSKATVSPTAFTLKPYNGLELNMRGYGFHIINGTVTVAEYENNGIRLRESGSTVNRTQLENNGLIFRDASNVSRANYNSSGGMTVKDASNVTRIHRDAEGVYQVYDSSGNMIRNQQAAGCDSMIRVGYTANPGQTGWSQFTISNPKEYIGFLLCACNANFSRVLASTYIPYAIAAAEGGSSAYQNYAEMVTNNQYRAYCYFGSSAGKIWVSTSGGPDCMCAVYGIRG